MPRLSLCRSHVGRLPWSALAGVFLPAVLLLIASASEGIAQEGDEPLRLIPLQQSEDGDGSSSEPGEGEGASLNIDSVAGVEGGDTTDPAAPALADGGIQVGALEAIDPDAAGVSVEGIEPFPGDLWSGSRRSRIEALLPRLPVAAPSFAMRRLALGLLTSPAQPPAGEGEAGVLALARAERLVAMGARDAALALLDRAGPAGSQSLTVRIENDRLLAAFDLDAACAQALGRVGWASDGYWHRVRILCQAHAGLIEATTLGLELLLETDTAPDPVFDDTIYAMAGLAEPVADPLAAPTPLRVAAWRLAQLPIPAEAVARAAPDVLPAIVVAPESLPGTRLLAAERAEATGALPIEALRDIYRAVAFSSEERADALARVESLEPPLGRALMLQAIEAETAPALRAELLAEALFLAEAQGAHGTAARALAHLVGTVPPAPAHVWFSAAAGRALIAAGEPDAAAHWYALATDHGPRTPEARGTALRLWPLMLLSGGDDHLTTAKFDAWLALRADERGRTVAVARANWLAILVDALGGRVDPQVWDRLLLAEQPVVTRASALALENGLLRAAEGGQRGETVLLALLLLGDSGPAAAGITTIGPVVSSLVSAGLQKEARAIALEAALAAGL